MSPKMSKKTKTENKDEGLVKFQEANCCQCRFANKRYAGSGLPCCTYPGKLLVSSDVCLTKLR